MKFRVLGSFEVVAGDKVLALGGAQRRAVLAALALHAPDPVAVDQLIDELWGGCAPTAAHAIQVHVSAIRKILRAGASENATAVRTSASGYALAVEAQQIDARRFERLLHQAQQALADDAAAARQRFEDALALWRGPPLADLRGSESPSGKRSGWRSSGRWRPRAWWRRGWRAERTPGKLIATITDLVAANPLRERPRRLLMLALYRNGRHRGAGRVSRRLPRARRDWPAARTRTPEAGAGDSPPRSLARRPQPGCRRPRPRHPQGDRHWCSSRRHDRPVEPSDGCARARGTQGPALRGAWAASSRRGAACHAARSGRVEARRGWRSRSRLGLSSATATERGSCRSRRLPTRR